jgi:outer membrane protein assembly factor BamB/peptidoglycan/xylan/chitin deacetylase (PgdA/CDA1 family)
VRRWLLLGGALVILIALGSGASYVLYVLHEGRDIRGSPDREFVPKERPKPPPAKPGIVWPTYGRDPERLRVATGISLAPPFRRVWMFRAQSLIEFPPVIAYGRLFFANNRGDLFAISTKTGKRAWKYRSGRCQAASPAVDGGTVYHVFMNRPPCNAKGSGLTGEVVAFAAGTGKIRWRKTIEPSESSPVVIDGALYLGDWSGNVYRLDAETGRVRWTFRAGGKVKGAVAVSGNRLFFGAYDAKVYSLDARTGKLIWTAKAQPRLGHSAEFYATPAIAYGRVFIGSTDGKEYAFGAGTGHLIWSHSTDDYVYSSAAVWRQRIFVGSYDGRLYCFDAATGDVLWSFRGNGPISGSPTIMAGRVYFSTLERMTYALDAKTGRQVWTFPDGKYTPLVADADRVYLTGYTRVYGLEERRAKPAKRAKRAVAARLRLPASLPARTLSLPILMYHRVRTSPPGTPEITRRLTVTTADFASQMRWLEGHGYHAVSQRQVFDALARGTPLPRKPVAITFDDGYEDVLLNAAPVLARLRMPATAYVITERIMGPEDFFLRWPELRKLERLGVAIGSHTTTHADLRTLSTAAALAELRNSRLALERGLGHPVQWLAYPFGSEDARIAALARQAGYVLAVTTNWGGEQSARAPLELRRYRILDTTGVAGLASILGGG